MKMNTVEIAINACDFSSLTNPYKNKNISEMKMSTINNYTNNNSSNSSKNAATAAINLDLTNGSNASIYECSSIASSDNDLSFSLAIDREVAAINNLNIDSDELPVFEIRLLSPTGTSTPSPISCDNNNRVKSSSCANVNADDSPPLRGSPCESNPEFVALSEINAQISPPSEYSTPANLSLETIYEGQFLNTPPRATLSRLQHTPKSGNRGSPRNLLEKFVVNRCLQLSTKDHPQQSALPASPLSLPSKVVGHLKEANVELHQKPKT